jgi:hypothetical protein
MGLALPASAGRAQKTTTVFASYEEVTHFAVNPNLFFKCCSIHVIKCSIQQFLTS